MVLKVEQDAVKLGTLFKAQQVGGAVHHEFLRPRDVLFHTVIASRE